MRGHAPASAPSAGCMLAVQSIRTHEKRIERPLQPAGSLILSNPGLADKRVYHAALNGSSLPDDRHQKDDCFYFKKK
ncbi:hypothetical protein C2845_PM07G07980 [Panicum miliaceum]|uniref:Uncharacterized protein n=1 Tax=Panicum miliaceum TaxID=4540 RepID=A0A3L6SLM4_PANMI|nr:hypothetical protein C2845_PM07G07980 [Panicum miliaceum]